MSTKDDIARIIGDWTGPSPLGRIAGAEEDAAEEILALLPGQAELRDALKEAVLNFESVVEAAQRALDRARSRLDAN
jgi:hypothetical protein